jgi:flavin-dependent dehydrogenase
VTNGCVALIGDASGMVDPITGEGICLAFKQAKALANALVRGELKLYEQAHTAMARRPRFMADFMLMMDRSRLLQQRTLAVFERHPRLFGNLLAMHVGQLSPTRFAMTAAVLGWKVATV